MEMMQMVLVTGANRGIGLGLAQHYLKKGGTVFATARNPEGSNAFAELNRIFGDRFIPLRLDVLSDASINELGMSLKEKDVELDLLINNAGISMEEDFGQWTAAMFDRHFKVNLIGPALVAQAVVPWMKNGSKLINVSSGMGSLELHINPDNGLDAYAVSKAALNMLTCRLAGKLGGQGIMVVSVSPGWVRTDMGGADADLSIDESVARLTGVIQSLTPEQNGRFLSETGEPLPW